MNKIDRLADSKTLLCWLNQEPEAIPLSATTGEGRDELADAVREHMIGGVRQVTITVSMADSRAVDFIEKRTEVLDRQYGDGTAQFTVRIGRRQVDQLLARSARIRINDQEPLEAVQTEWGDR